MLIFHSFLDVTAWRLYSVPYANPPWSKAERRHSWKTSGGHTLAGRRCNICQEALGNLTKLHWRIKTWGPFLHKWNFSNCLETNQVNRTVFSFFKTTINSNIAVTDPRPVPRPLRRKSLVQSAKHVLCYCMYRYLFPYVWIWTQTFTDWWLRSLSWLKKVIDVVWFISTNFTQYHAVVFFVLVCHHPLCLCV